MLQTQFKVQLMGKQHTISYPNVGQKLEIESAKMLFSGGIYGQLAKNSHKTANELLDVIDAFSYFGVLIPELKPTLTHEFMNNMDPLTAMTFRNEFRKYYDFMNNIEAEINKQFDDKTNK